jgi:hypothetical protein
VRLRAPEDELVVSVVPQAGASQVCTEREEAAAGAWVQEDFTGEIFTGTIVK